MALGDNLMAKGLISREQLEQALAEQKKTPDIRLGEILVKLGFVTKEQVESSL
jgi:hypothetical protein